MQQYLGDSTDDEDAGRESVPHFSGEDRVQDQCDSTGDKASCDVNTSSSWSPMRPRPPEKQFAKPSWSRMMELDRHVLSTQGIFMNRQVSELVQHLSMPTQTMLEIVYVIFRWVACQQTKHRTPKMIEKVDDKEDEVKTQTVGIYLQHLQQGSVDHADLFSTLCRCANIETHKVTGQVRFYKPQPSAKLFYTRDASWSAVLLPGGWGLIDCSMGSRHWPSKCDFFYHSKTGSDSHPNGFEEDVTDNDNSQRSMRAEMWNPSRKLLSEERTNTLLPIHQNVQVSDENYDSSNNSGTKPMSHYEFAPHNFYFLPSPELLVTSHLPDNKDWQLLPNPVAEMDFYASLLLKPYFHYLQVELEFPTKLTVRGIEEETEVKWKTKGGHLRKFAFRLFALSEASASSEDLTQYGFLENMHAHGDVRLRLCPPTSGRYVCELYGNYLLNTRHEMTHICSFDMEFVRVTASALKFPHNDRMEWGPGGDCLSLGMRPVSHGFGCVYTDSGQAEIIFACSKLLLVTQKLWMMRENMSPREMEGSVVNYRDFENSVKILVRIPSPGDYVLSLYAKEETRPGKCTLVCNYYVICDEEIPSQLRLFPAVPNWKLGPTKAFSDFEICLRCPLRTCVITAPFTGKVAFAFCSPDNVELSFELQHTKTDVKEFADTSDYVQHTSKDGENVFRVRLPESGDYVFHLYGKVRDGEGHKFLLYTALVDCTVPCKDCFRLPRVAFPWHSRVHILSPLRKFLVLGTVTHFAVRGYRLALVAIVSRSSWQHFVRDTNEVKVNNLEKAEPVKTGDDVELEYFLSIKNSFESKTNVSEDFENTLTKDTASKFDAVTEVDGDVESPAKNEEMKEKQEDIEEADDGWHIWRCTVVVEVDDEDTNLQLFVEASDHDEDDDGVPVCVAEFEVISEKRMESMLRRQQELWSDLDKSASRRPGSAKRPDLHDEERQFSYFQDDELYISNPLGDESAHESDSDGSYDSDDDDDRDDDTDDLDDETATDESKISVGDQMNSDVTSESEKTESTASGSKRSQSADKALTDTTTKRVSPLLQDGTVPPKDKRKRPGKTNRSDEIHKVYDSRRITPKRSRPSLPGNQKSQKSNMVPEDKIRPLQKVESDNIDEAGEEKNEHTQKSKYVQKSNLAITERGNGASKNRRSRERIMRRRLWNACQRRDRESIQKAVKRYTRHGYSSCPDLDQAQRLLHFFELKDALLEAIEAEDSRTIRKSLVEVEENGYAGEMSAVCRKAHRVLSTLKGTQRLPVVAETDMRTLLEIRSYRCPPEAVHHVVVSTLLLMGFHEGMTKKWSKCQKRIQLLGSRGMHQKMKDIQIESIHPEIAARARLLLENETQQEAAKAGPGVLALFNWGQSVVTRVEELAGNDNSTRNNDNDSHRDTIVHPANRRRQREIFKQQNETRDKEPDVDSESSARIHNRRLGNEFSSTDSQGRENSGKQSNTSYSPSRHKSRAKSQQSERSRSKSTTGERKPQGKWNSVSNESMRKAKGGVPGSKSATARLTKSSSRRNTYTPPIRKPNTPKVRSTKSARVSTRNGGNGKSNQSTSRKENPGNRESEQSTSEVVQVTQPDSTFDKITIEIEQNSGSENPSTSSPQNFTKNTETPTESLGTPDVNGPSVERETNATIKIGAQNKTSTVLKQAIQEQNIVTNSGVDKHNSNVGSLSEIERKSSIIGSQAESERKNSKFGSQTENDRKNSKAVSETEMKRKNSKAGFPSNQSVQEQCKATPEKPVTPDTQDVRRNGRSRSSTTKARTALAKRAPAAQPIVLQSTVYAYDINFSDDDENDEDKNMR